MKPDSNETAMKRAQDKVKTPADVARDHVTLENNDRIQRGEEAMSNLEKRRRQAEIFDMMHGLNNENSEDRY